MQPMELRKVQQRRHRVPANQEVAPKFGQHRRVDQSCERSPSQERSVTDELVGDPVAGDQLELIYNNATTIDNRSQRIWNRYGSVSE
jgi:hypothetical protein